MSLSPLDTTWEKLQGADDVDPGMRRSLEMEHLSREFALLKHENAQLREKTRSLSIVSHELRNPLNAILGSLSLVAEGVAGELPDRSRRMIQIARQNSERLLRMVDDLLDLRRLEAGKLDVPLKPLELVPVVERAVEACRPLATARRIELCQGLDLPGIIIEANSDHMIQVLTNLLANAVQVSGEERRVSIDVSLVERHARVSISDDGPGIPEEFRSCIFDEFTRIPHPGTARSGGSGLGLCITRALVEQMHGKIWFETELHQGTTFHVDLPRHVASVVC